MVSFLCCILIKFVVAILCDASSNSVSLFVNLKVSDHFSKDIVRNIIVVVARREYSLCSFADSTFPAIVVVFEVIILSKLVSKYFWIGTRDVNNQIQGSCHVLDKLKIR